MEEVNGNLIKLALEGNFDIIAHGCNCFCRMGSGIAPQIKEAFPGAGSVDQLTKTGDIMKLGTYTYVNAPYYDESVKLTKTLIVINAYTQYNYDAKTKPLDYEALTLCMRKINHNYPGKTIGLPKIGSGLAGGHWPYIKTIIKAELKDMNIIIVNYVK